MLCRYEYYYALLRDFPDIKFTINGGITSVVEVKFLASFQFTMGTMGCQFEAYIKEDIVGSFEVNKLVTLISMDPLQFLSQ